MSQSYLVHHTSTFLYESTVRDCHNQLLLQPRTDGRVQCESQRLIIRPHPRHIRRRTDYFGNIVHGFAIDEDHRQLVVTSKLRVTVTPPFWPQQNHQPDWRSVRDGIANQTDPNWLQACMFVFPSPRVSHASVFRSYAEEVFQGGLGLPQGLLQLTERIFDEFKYDKTATNVDTRTETAFELRRGVCQDFAHILIACLRAIGIPARYVSGYIRTIGHGSQEALVGADQSHAWVSVYGGSSLGWLEVDPTNRCICSDEHIPIAWGRDYSDLVPIRGVYLGGGTQSLQVAVQVVPLDN